MIELLKQLGVGLCVIAVIVSFVVGFVFLAINYTLALMGVIILLLSWRIGYGVRKNGKLLGVWL